MTAPQLYSSPVKKNTPDPIPGIRDVRYVEMRGVEPLSENPSTGLSPSAFRALSSFYISPRKKECKSSFIITDIGAKLSRYSFPAILTPGT